MDMINSKAVILLENREALRVAASAARISTQQGTALSIYEGSRGDEKDLRLIDKVLSSGHKSVIEHQTFSLAFNDVSVLMEQFVIEARLASFTVKSRRYVDFAGAGYVRPELDPAQRAIYDAVMERRFADYQALMEMGVPKEDARFVLPYCLRSNFYMTLDARELIALICAMLWGRGSGYPELARLGEQLKAQFDALYPGVIDREAGRCAAPRASTYAVDGLDGAPRACVGDAELISAPSDAMGLLSRAMAFSGRFELPEGKPDAASLRALMTDGRPRELELLDYVFAVKNISLACLTHFTRHRIDSPLIPAVGSALTGGRYVLPESVRALPKAEELYRAAFEDERQAALALVRTGISWENLSYLAMSGHELDILLGMNARQLQHFMKLRTCQRAQWEIRGVAEKMLELLNAQTPEIFRFFGPSCRLAPCPEGRMSCGQPRTMPK